jgi:hypothetical protein
MAAKKTTKARKPMRTPKKRTYKLELVRGVEGDSIYLNGYRIAGPKPWGGGPVAAQWVVTDEDLNTAVKRG